MKMTTWMLAAAILGVAIGCQKGPQLGTVTGVIKYEGKPMEKATITFAPADGQTSFDRTGADGSYELTFPDGRPGALVGENTVSIESYRVDSDEQGNIIEYPEILPDKYHIESELTRTVKPGAQVFDFNLTKD